MRFPCQSGFQRTALGVVLACLLVTASAQAQENPCLRRTVLVSVTNEKGITLGGLAPENFRSSFRRKPVRILSVQEKAIAPRIVVVLDASGSMNHPDESKWRLAATLVAHAARAFSQQTPTALVVFSDRIELQVGFDRPQQSVIDAVSALQHGGAKKPPFGRTPLYAAILRAVEMLRPSRPGDVIYVISDAGENASKSREKDVERALLESGARLFAALLNDQITRSRMPEVLEGAEVLQYLIRTSGGGVIQIPSYVFRGKAEAVLSASLDGLYRRMSELYSIELELPLEVDKPREWKLELVPTPGVQTRKAQILYPAKLLPCRSGK